MRRIVPLLICLLAPLCAFRAFAECVERPLIELPDAALYAGDDSLPFRFPLEETGPGTDKYASFCTSGRNKLDAPYSYHAAEDYHRPAGTPVYAMADGQVSFSGTMGGYGWLVIVDHPRANLYSLYGHLSPSRWKIEPGPVNKGTLLGYLGDDDENGGSARSPLVTHLHFGVRAGQRDDYPGKGEWRWQAGWIKPCPPDLGWLRPSEVIALQTIPSGGYIAPEGPFFEVWGIELVLSGIYLIGAVCISIFAIRKDKPLALIIAGAAMTGLWWLFGIKGMQTANVVLCLAVLLGITGVYRLARGRLSARSE